MKMPESLSDMFTEAMEADDSVEIEPVGDDSLDNLDDGADDDFEDVDQGDEIAEDDEDTDTDESDEDSEVEPSADTDDFDWNEILQKYGDRTVTLTVQGQPVEAKLSDLPNMAMMREDYSRKTAEVAEVRKAATWAQDVQAAFANDPIGTLQAFAEAYGIQPPSVQPVENQSDPYEDLDPDVAAVLRKMDEQEARHQSELAVVRDQVSRFENDRIMEEVKAEVRELADEFGDELDTVEMLRIAATHNVPLREAAEFQVGRSYFAKSKEQLALEAQAREAGQKRSGQDRERSKKRASGTATKRFDASDTSVDDFNTISELFEIEMNSVS